MPSTISQTNAKYKTAAVPEEPAIGLAVPFQPTMQSKNEISQTITAMLSKTKRMLDETYSEDLVLETMVKLESLINNLYHGTGKKSIVITIDKGTERVIYLNQPVAAKLLINEPFYLGDLVENKQSSPPLLFLILGGNWAKLYHFEDYLLRRLSFDRGEYHQCSLFTGFDSSALQHRAVPADENKLFRTTNCNLSLFYQNSFCPLIVAGNTVTVNAFIRATPYKHHIVDTVYTDKNSICDEEVMGLLKAVISKGRILRQKHLLNIIHHTHRHADLLSREKNTETTPKTGENFRMIIDQEQMSIKRKELYPDITTNSLAHLDTAIEQVLKNNGHIETIDGGMPGKYGGIVLLKQEKYLSPVRRRQDSYDKRGLL